MFRIETNKVKFDLDGAGPFKKVAGTGREVDC